MFRKLDINNFKKNDIFSKKDVLSVISGSWLDKLYFDKVKFWDIDNDHPTYIKLLIIILKKEWKISLLI